jgi:hypothetical protein
MYIKDIRISGTNSGYYYFIDYTHPLATGNSGRVYVHRHNASIKLGYWITSEQHVHHLDQDKLNNSLDNLSILTNTEHAQLHTNTIVPKPCKVCGSIFTPAENKIVCCSQKCRQQLAIKDTTITKEVLDSLIPKMSWVSLGKMFGYSDNGIKKRAISLGCILPDRKSRR